MGNMDIVRMQADRLLEQAKEINRLLEEITRLRAATAWQPIETAPRDGTTVLLWLVDGQMMIDGEYAIQGFHSARAWRTEFHVTAEPTHWQPLPTPPEGESHG